MKRSEMLQKIENLIMSYDEMSLESANLYAHNILTEIENEGMLPPKAKIISPIPNHPDEDKFGYIEINMWEK